MAVRYRLFLGGPRNGDLLELEDSKLNVFVSSVSGVCLLAKEDTVTQARQVPCDSIVEVYRLEKVIWYGLMVLVMVHDSVPDEAIFPLFKMCLKEFPEEAYLLLKEAPLGGSQQVLSIGIYK